MPFSTPNAAQCQREGDTHHSTQGAPAFRESSPHRLGLDVPPFSLFPSRKVAVVLEISIALTNKSRPWRISELGNSHSGQT